MFKMKRGNGLQRDDRGAGAGDPVELGGRAEARSSGVHVRGAQAPLDEGPCTSCEDVIRRCKHYIWSRIRRSRIAESEAEDIFQNVIVKLDRHIAAQGIPDRVTPLLLTLIGNEIRSHVRGKQRRRIDGEPDADALPSSKPNPEQLLGLAEDAAEEKRIVEATFARMRPHEVHLIQLAHLRGLSLREIAEIAGAAEGTVRVQLHRARARFRELAAPFYNLCNGSRGKR